MQCFGFYDMLPSNVTSATLRAKIGAASAGHEAALEVIHSKFVQRVALASVLLRRLPRTRRSCLSYEGDAEVDDWGPTQTGYNVYNSTVEATYKKPSRSIVTRTPPFWLTNVLKQPTRVLTAALTTIAFPASASQAVLGSRKQLPQPPSRKW